MSSRMISVLLGGQQHGPHH